MDKIAYLKGLLDGQETDPNSREGKVLYAFVEAFEELVKCNQELEDRVAELEELCEILDEDLGDVEELLSEELDEQDAVCDCKTCPEDCGSGFDDDEQYEAICPTCGKCILLDEKSLEDGEVICPNCGEELEFDFNAEEIEALAPDESEE